MPADPPRICDYEGSPYRRAFWEDADRRYEDAAERLALRSLLPPDGRRLVEIGAGFGRLIDEYRGYGEIILVDYARSMLADARQRIGDGATYVCADLYRLPFATGALDAAVQIRVLHHVEAVPEAIREVARVLAPGGSYVLEFANKRNLKGIARWVLRRQAENPFDHRPHEFVPLNWNFHPSSRPRSPMPACMCAGGARCRCSVHPLRSAPCRQRCWPDWIMCWVARLVVVPRPPASSCAPPNSPGADPKRFGAARHVDTSR